MNEEEMNNYFNDKYGCSYKRLEELFDFEIDRQVRLLDKLEQREQENQQLKDRINKAIEYINWWVEDNKKQKIGLTISETDGLLLLLKGDKE